jgi:hypothetical protein
MQQSLEGYPGKHELFVSWAYAKDQNTMEGRILAIADLWSVVLYSRRELLMGNAYAIRLLKEVGGYLRTLAIDLETKGGSKGTVTLYQIVNQLSLFAFATTREDRSKSHLDLEDPYDSWKTGGVK